MGSFSIWHWMAVMAVILLMFGGGGKLSRIMGDMGHGIKAFRSGLRDTEADLPKPQELLATDEKTARNA
jgi:sec-independent protein translocase protein TatA